MFQTQIEKRRAVLLATAVGALCVAGPAIAQDAGSDAPKTASKRPTVSAAKPAAPSAMVALVNGLVKRGVFTEEEAAAYIKQAEEELYIARQAAKDATARAEDAAKTAASASAAASPPGTKRVSHVPETVKRQLREEIRKEVFARAQSERWASPGLYPEWASRIRLTGDARMRYERQFFPKDNVQSMAVDFNAINTGKPDNIGANNPYWFPTYNVTEDRERARLRARLGVEADLADNFLFAMRIATGDSNSPVSTNQTLGGGSGNFSKYSLWLDRAFVRYQPAYEYTGLIGRFDNPFFTAGDMVWNRDIGFDGAAIQFKRDLVPNFTGFLNAGVFAIFNSALNAGIDTAYDPVKFKSHDKWLQGAQLGFATRFDDVWSVTVAGAFYNFTGVKGKPSSPCDNTDASTVCSTDNYRPLFAQKGNTYMALRAGGDYYRQLYNTASNYQYFGLASEFRPLVVNARIDNRTFWPVQITLEGEFVKNTAFNKAEVAQLALNNFAPEVRYGNGTTIPANYDGGDTGYYGRLTVGHPVLKQLWDWNAHIGYKYVESDATVDAFTDSDFGMGGTNLKGYFLGASLGLGANVWTTVRWLSANAIAGAPASVDIVQVDLNAKF